LVFASVAELLDRLTDTNATFEITATPACSFRHRNVTADR
jgi:hypothetical protein